MDNVYPQVKIQKPCYDECQNPLNNKFVSKSHPPKLGAIEAKCFKKNEVIDQQKLEQARKEKILLASYTNPEEIDLARDRNLQLDQAALQALTQQKMNVTTRITRNNKTAQGFQSRKKPIPPYLSEDLKLSKTESANIDKQLAQRKLSMEATRKHYAEEKARFIALKIS